MFLDAASDFADAFFGESGRFFVEQRARRSIRVVSTLRKTSQRTYGGNPVFVVYGRIEYSLGTQFVSAKGISSALAFFPYITVPVEDDPNISFEYRADLKRAFRNKISTRDVKIHENNFMFFIAPTKPQTVGWVEVTLRPADATRLSKKLLIKVPFAHQT